MTTLILTGIAVFLVINLLATVALRYYNGNDGWLEWHLTKRSASTIIESVD